MNNKVKIKCVECETIYERVLSYKIKNNIKNNDFICKSCKTRGKNNPFYGKTHKKQSIEKMSEKLSDGRRKGENNSFYGKTHSPEFCEAQRIRQKKWVKENLDKCVLGGLNASSLYERMTGIEIKVQNFFEENNIDYEWSFFFKNKQFDFKVGNFLIEVHGDYWHSLPHKIEMDEIKRKLVEDYSTYELIVIWETEINNGDFSKLERLLHYETKESETL